jgi:hypothetical protein
MPTFTAANPNVISTAGFFVDTYTYDPLYADATVSQSANIAGSLGVLKRGTVLFGPAAGSPITNATLLTTVATGAVQRCILAVDTDTTGGQVTSLVYTQGKFLDTAITFSSSGAASDCANLWDFGIYVLTVEQRSGILVPMMKLPATGGPLPQSMSVKDAAQATKDQVEALKAAMAAFQPAKPPEPPPPSGLEPAWAIVAFGEPKPTQEQQVKDQIAQGLSDLAANEQKALDDLKTQQEQQLSQLLQQQQQARAQYQKQCQAALDQAKQADAQAQAPPTQQPPRQSGY